MDLNNIIGGTIWEVPHGGTGVSSLTDGGVLLGSGTGDITAMGVLADGAIIVGDGTTDPVAESGATARASLGLTIGTNVQAYDADLAAIAGLTSAANKGIQFTGSGTAGVYDLTAAGKALLDDADAGAQRTTLGLGTMAVQAKGAVDIDGGTITGITDLAVADGGTGVSTFTDGGILLGSGTNPITAMGVLAQGTIIFGDGSTDPTTLAINTSGNRVLTNTGGYNDTPVWLPYASVCFLKGTKITLPDYSQKNIEDLTLADDVLTYNIDGISNIKDKNVLKNVQLDSMVGKISQSGIRNIWVNPTDSYLFINGKLKVTKNHIVHFKRDNQYYFRFAEHLTIGDELFTDKDKYESIESIEEIHEKTNVYNFELDKDNTYFAENYLVHHYCELCSGYSNII